MLGHTNKHSDSQVIHMTHSS